MPNRDLQKEYPELTDYSPLMRELLIARGIDSKDEAEKFLHPSYTRDLHDPDLMHDMEKACVRIFEAVEAKEKIVVYCDYDCDGIPGAVIMHDFFKKIGHTTTQIYIPDRHGEGYGLNKEAIEGFVKEGVTLLVTVDLGISNVEEVAQAITAGIQVIITDHHLPPPVLPHAFALVNPKLGEYPDPMLCGSGVAFKLVQALIKKYGEYWKITEGWEKWLLDMAGLATLSDMVPLVKENRALAYFGLKVLQKTRRLGMLELLRKLDISPRHLTEDDLTFMVTPRINAASRMDSPMRAFELLSTDTPAEAIALAEHLTKINDERKLHVAAIMKEAYKTLEKRELPELVIIGNPNWRVGVLGLVASKISEEYGKTAFVWGMEGSNIIKGSCRGDGMVNVVTLMAQAGEGTFLDYGGHELAGGFSVAHDRIHTLEASLLEALPRSLRDLSETLENKYPVLPLSEVVMRTYEEISALAPFGLGNPKPIFLFELVHVDALKLFGKEKNHLEIIVSDAGRSRVKAIAFFSTESSFTKKVVKDEYCNLLATFDLSHFAGRTELRLRIIDIL